MTHNSGTSPNLSWHIDIGTMVHTVVYMQEIYSHTCCEIDMTRCLDSSASSDGSSPPLHNSISVEIEERLRQEGNRTKKKKNIKRKRCSFFSVDTNSRNKTMLHYRAQHATEYKLVADARLLLLFYLPRRCRSFGPTKPITPPPPMVSVSKAIHQATMNRDSIRSAKDRSRFLVGSCINKRTSSCCLDWVRCVKNCKWHEDWPIRFLSYGIFKLQRAFVYRFVLRTFLEIKWKFCLFVSVDTQKWSVW